VSHHGVMTTAPATPDNGSAVGDWGAGTIARPRPGPGLAVLAGGVLVLAIVMGLAAPALGVAGGIVLLGGLAVWVGSRGRALIRASGARRLEAHEAPRLENIVSGLAADLGVTEPGLWISERGGPNAFVAWSGGPQIGVTRSLLTGFTRTEMEAVVAHCLVRIVEGEARATTLGSGLGPLARGGGAVGGTLDVVAASVTRYPPALASAIGKAEPRSGRFARAWFVSGSSSHVPAEERVAALQDL
jgi:hypothetical protein